MALRIAFNPQGIDHGSHQGAVNRIERQQRDAGIIPRALEIAIQETRGEIVTSMRHEIHDEECDVVEDVDIAQLWVELEAIERHQYAAPAHDIAGMQIAVAFANARRLLP